MKHVSGMIDLNPARIEYMLRGLLGGPFDVFDKGWKLYETVSGDRDFEWRNIPIAHTFLKEGDERTANRKVQNEYFKLIKEYEDTRKKLKDYDENSHSQEEQDKRNAELVNSKKYQHYLVVDNYKPLLDALHDANKNESEYSAAEINELENTIRRQMVDFIHSMEDANEGNKPNVDEHVNEMLKKNFERGGYTRKSAGKQIAKRLGGTDTYGHPSDNLSEGCP